MKKFRFLLAFMLSLFFVLLFSSCEEKFPNPEKDKAIVEIIEQNYLALKPHYLTPNAYKNPKNIFLEKKSTSGQTPYTYNWYKKVNGVYQIFSLNDQSERELNLELVYEIADTLYVSPQTQKINNNWLKKNNTPVEMAYKNGSVLITKIKNQEMLSQYFWLKTKFTVQDSLLNYDPKTKGFFTSKTALKSEIKTNLGPIILVLLFFIFSLGIILRDKITWLKNVRENIFDSFFSDCFDHRLNSFILFLLIAIFNLVYFLIWDDSSTGLIIVTAVVLGLIARLIYWLDKPISDNKYFSFTKLSSIFIISGILALELILIEVPQKFGVISLSLVFLPALINLIVELINYQKLKRKPKNNI